MLVESTVFLDHSEEADLHYAMGSRVRRRLKAHQRPGSDASDGDLWVIASTIEYGLVLMSHDKQQIALAREVGLPTFTNLPGLREANPALSG